MHYTESLQVLGQELTEKDNAQDLIITAQSKKIDELQSSLQELSRQYTQKSVSYQRKAIKHKHSLKIQLWLGILALILSSTILILISGFSIEREVNGSKISYSAASIAEVFIGIVTLVGSSGGLYSISLALNEKK